MKNYKIPLGAYGEDLIDFILSHFQPAVDVFVFVVNFLESLLYALFGLIPPPLLIFLFTLVAWRACGRSIAMFAILSLLLLWNLGLWVEMLQTLSLTLTATVLALIIAIPIGIIMAESQVFRFALVPILDFLQTMPRFVYLIPAVVLLGIGTVPAIFATLTLSIPPPARLTAVGLLQVDSRAIEAAEALGSTRWQVLTKLKLPLALPTIMLGINQCLMMALSMVVIASFIGAEGLGENILTAIMQLQAGDGIVAGLGIFVLAVLIDRITKGWAGRLSRWYGQDTVKKG